jgi:hypothetical protein
MLYLYYTLIAYAFLVFMGAGLTYYILPKRLASYGLIFCPFVGYAWAMLLTWHAYQADLPGTNAYGPYVLVSALGINAAAYWHSRRPGRQASPWLNLDACLALIPAAIGLSFVTIPFVMSVHGPTTMALGNNDIADYACMARFIQEFPRSSQQGFLGQFDNFRKLSDEIWFGPAAITSLFSTVLDVPSFRVQSLCVNLFFALGIPFVYVLSREVFGVKRWYGVALAAIYAFHPILFRVVYDGFHGQLMATALMPGFLIAALLCAREESWRDKLCYVPILIVFCWAFMISYSFTLFFAVWTVSAFVLLSGMAEARIKAGLQTGVVFAVSLLGTFALSPMRTEMLYRQLALAKSQGGYYLGFLSPERVMGLLGNDLFADGARPGLAGVLMACIVTVLLAGVWRAWLVGRRELLYLLVPLLTVSGFSMYLFFGADAASLPFASYKAFKPIGVFLPVFQCLVFVALWHLVSRLGKARVVVLGCCLGGVILGEAHTSKLLVDRMRHTAAVVTGEMAELLTIDADPRIVSLNVFTSDLWPYLWHTYFLMNKQLYLQTSAYARPRSFPHGDFDLLDRKNTTDAQRPYLSLRYLNHRYQIAEIRRQEHLPVQFGPGWWDPETTHRWAGATGRTYTVYLNTNQAGLAEVKGLFLIALQPADKITVTVNGQPVPIMQSTADLKSEPFQLRKGRNTLEFTHSLPPLPPSSNDPRSLLVAWKEIIVDFVDRPIDAQ